MDDSDDSVLKSISSAAVALRLRPEALPKVVVEEEAEAEAAVEARDTRVAEKISVVVLTLSEMAASVDRAASSFSRTRDDDAPNADVADDDDEYDVR